jgi:hypothetical protein
MYSATFIGINEPSLDELFAEPMIQMIMRRDGVARDALEDVLAQLAAISKQQAPIQ